MYKNCKQNLQSLKRYEGYLELKDKYNSIIKSIDTTGRDLQTTEQGGMLIISFPKADTISNGQRDIVTLLINLVQFNMSYDKSKRHILIID